MFVKLSLNVTQTLNINSRSFEHDRVSYIDMVLFCCEVL